MLPRRAKDSDTDPSTPEALRLPGEDTDPGVGPPAAMKATQRGLGSGMPPSSAPPPSPVRSAITVPLGRGVPGDAPVGPKKDSVELLLEGMPDLAPQTPRTMPQTAGQSSAAYHVEHAVRPAHTSPDEVPKVLVERPPQHATVRIDRARVQASMDEAAAIAAARQAPASEGLPLSLRIAVAVVAGLAVVAVMFLVARSSTRSASGDPEAPASSPTPSPPLSAVVAPSTATVAASATASAPVPTPEPAAATASASPAPADTALTAAPPVGASPTPTPAPAPRPRPRSPAPPSGSDLGEFKTTFH